ncbi:MAG TPA: hypothetical protein VNZ03_01755 [Terriglobales bacterium]|nr:hypothetical protein [Terriglobales bacterium]
MKTASLASLLRGPQAVGLALCMTFALSVHAQQATNAATIQSDTNQQLLQRINELEVKVKQLENKPAAPAPPPAPAPEPQAVETPHINEVAPRLHLNVFGDVGAQVYNHNPDTFYFGSLDLFMTGRISDRVTTLAEVLFIAHNDNTVTPDVERLLLQYHSSDYFTAAIGRYHTGVGYYNSAFNYGAFLETSIDRPFIYAFDDLGGVLPMQDVGVTVTGKIPSGKMGLNYLMEVGNGQSWIPGSETSQNNQDANNSKSINGGLFMRPEAISGLEMGFSVRHDNLSVPGPAVGELISTVHVVYINSDYEILNEGVLVRHVESTGPVFSTSGFYSQLSRRFRSYRPYFRYQYFNAPSNDPVYVYAGPNPYAPADVTKFVGRLNGPSAGIRYDFSEHSALKFQYDRVSLRGLAAQNALSTQLAFTF